MERKYMLPPDKPCQPRIGPQFQAQIPDFKPQVFQPVKREREENEESKEIESSKKEKPV